MNIDRMPKTETHQRPYKDETIDELFEEILEEATSAQDILNFAFGIYEDKGDANIKVRTVMTYLCAIKERLENVTNGLPCMIKELKHREKDS